MNPVNPKKLLHSKWTAVKPKERQKHFVVTEVLRDDAGVPQACVLESVFSHQEIKLNWRELSDSRVWKRGWK